MHSKNIKEVNLKPGKIVIGEDRSVKIADFCIEGIMRKVREEKKISKGSDWSSFPYKAPEIVKNIESSESSDIWSLGCLVIYMLTGSEPWQN